MLRYPDRVRRSTVILALLGLGVLLGAVLWAAGPSRHPVEAVTAKPGAVPERATSGGRASADPGVASEPNNGGKAAASSRAHIRAQILAAAAAADASRLGAANSGRPVSTGTARDGEPEYGPGNLRMHVAGHDALHAELNHDFMPLADECIDHARARTPSLEGMLAIGFEIVADQELGAIIDEVEFADTNEIDDPELQQCVRESLASLMLPPGAQTGRSELLLTLPIEPDGGSTSG